MRVKSIRKVTAVAAALATIFAMGQIQTASAITPIHGHLAVSSPSVTTQPEFDTVAQVGVKLTISKGVWKNKPTSYKYQWFNCTKQPKEIATTKQPKCSPIGGKTKNSYTPVTKDVGQWLDVSVTASNKKGKKSTFIGFPDQTLDENIAPVNTDAPVVTVDSADPNTLDGSDGNWTGDPTGYAYQWYDCTDQQADPSDTLSDTCTEITDATSAQYQPTVDDAGNFLLIGVTATNDNGDTTTYSASTDTALDAPAVKTAATIGGTNVAAPSVGQVLTGNTGVWDSLLPADTSYTWMACADAVTPASDTSPDNCDPVSRRTEVSVGSNFACSALPSGAVWCWGTNTDGQLGSGNKTSNDTPVAVKNISTAVDVSAGGNHACALLVDGSVSCWGAGSSTPAAVAGLTGVKQISVGATSACVILADNSVSCWGGNTYGQLGNGTNASSAAPVATGITNAAQVAVGDAQACAVLTDATADCWGRNNTGQLGDGTTTDSNVPVAVSNLTTASSIATGTGHTCVVDTNGSVLCWGDNSNGQLGTGDTTSQLTLTTPADVVGVNQVTVAGNSTCALMADNSINCWGDNSGGQLGDGTTTDSLIAVGPDITSATEIGLSSGGFGCAVADDYVVKCWGTGTTGIYGDNGSVTDTSLHTATIADDGKLLLTPAEVGTYIVFAVTASNVVGASTWYTESTGAVQ